MPVSAPDCTVSELAVASVRLVLGGMLVLAGGLKTVRRAELMALIEALGLPPGRLAAISTRVLPGLELSAGIWLALGSWARAALTLTLILLAGFTVTLLLLVRRGYVGSCACFGAVDRHGIGVTQMLRNIILILAAAVALSQPSGGDCGRAPIWALPPLVLAIALMILIVGTLVYMLAAEVETLAKVAAGVPTALPIGWRGDRERSRTHD